MLSIASETAAQPRRWEWAGWSGGRSLWADSAERCVPGVREVLQPHVQPAGPHAPARRQQALQVPLLLQQV